MTDTAQIYLQTPKQFDLIEFVPVLTGLLASTPIACLRMSMASSDPITLRRAADALRQACHEHDVAIVIDDHYRLAETHGLDGVHLTDSNRSIREARKLLGPDAIVGCYCGNSRHAGMTAAEIGVDYVSFGPLSDSGLGDGTIAEMDLFQWWSEMIEVPVVAEGGLNDATLAAVKDYADFLCIGPEIWETDSPQAALDEIIAKIA